MEPQIAEANKGQHQQQRLGQADATEVAGPTVCQREDREQPIPCIVKLSYQSINDRGNSFHIPQLTLTKLPLCNDDKKHGKSNIHVITEFPACALDNSAVVGR